MFIHGIFQATVLEWGAIAFSVIWVCTLQIPGGSDGKESTCNVVDLGLIPGLAGAGGVQTAKASREQSSLSGKESAQGCIPIVKDVCGEVNILLYKCLLLYIDSQKWVQRKEIAGFIQVWIFTE